MSDLGNALPRQWNGDPLDLGTLYFGVLVNGVIQPFGEAIPYTDANSDMWRHSGVVEQSIGTDIVNSLENSKLVVFIDSATITGGKGYPIKETFPSMQSNETVSLLLSELDYFIRPMDYYQDQLEYSSGNEEHPVKSSSDFTLLVTQFGQPVSDINVTVIHSYNQAGQPVLPHGAVTPIDATKVTDSNGQVTFTFAVNQPIPENRSYLYEPCSDNVEDDIFTPLRRAIDPKAFSTTDVKGAYNEPIDGQMYNFYYCVGEQCMLPNDNGFFMFKAVISILAFSTVIYEQPCTWVDHVQPVFRQMHHVYYIMRTVLDMSNYTEVTSQHNIELLKMVLSKLTSDPNYMPTTRDLSPIKMRMIATSMAG